MLRIPVVVLSVVAGILVLTTAAIWVARKFISRSPLPDYVVKVDSSTIAYMEIYPGDPAGDTIILRKIDTLWEIRVQPEMWKPASARYTRSIIRQISEIKPAFIVTTEPDQWHRFKVDTTGVRIVLRDAQEKVLADFIVGNFNFLPGQGMVTYVRLTDEPTVYAVNEFIELGLSPKINDWRDATLIRDSWRDWKIIEISCRDKLFVIAADTATPGNWTLNSRPVDSLLTVRLLQKLVFLRADAFADDVSPDQLPPQPSLSIRITKDGGSITEVRFYSFRQDTMIRVLAVSSLQPRNVIMEMKPRWRVHEYVEEYLSQVLETPSAMCR